MALSMILSFLFLLQEKAFRDTGAPVHLCSFRISNSHSPPDPLLDSIVQPQPILLPSKTSPPPQKPYLYHR